MKDKANLALQVIQSIEANVSAHGIVVSGTMIGIVSKQKPNLIDEDVQYKVALPMTGQILD